MAALGRDVKGLVREDLVVAPAVKNGLLVVLAAQNGLSVVDDRVLVEVDVCVVALLLAVVLGWLSSKVPRSNPKIGKVAIIII